MNTYTVRYDFPKDIVTFNKDTKNEHKSSVIEFYGNSLDEVSNIDINKCEFIDLSNIHSYTKTIWEKLDTDNFFSFINRDTVYI